MSLVTIESGSAIERLKPYAFNIIGGVAYQGFIKKYIPSFQNVSQDLVALIIFTILIAVFDLGPIEEIIKGMGIVAGTNAIASMLVR